MRIAIHLLSQTGHGIGVVVGRLAGELATRGHDVTLLCSVADEKPPALPTGVQVHTIGSARARDQIAPLVRLLRRQRPDVLMTTHVKYTDLAVLAMMVAGVRMPLVAVEHNELSHELRHWGSWKAQPMRAVAAAAYRRTDAIVAVSRAVADDVAVQLALDPARIEVIYNPVINPAIGHQAAAPTTHPWLQDNRALVVAAGRLAPQKDHATLLMAMSLVRRDVDARLAVLGEGPLQSSLDRLRAQLGLQDAVLLHGQVANPYPWLSHAAVVVSSSIYEGLPTALVEALALGAPVVATDAGGSRELLGDGRFGRVTPPGDPVALAAALHDCLTQPQQRPADIEDWLRQFTVEEAGGRYEALLCRAAGMGA